jgi:hypothetical protein
MDTRTLKNIYKKINTKTKLSAIKTQLGAVDELQQAYGELENITYPSGGSPSLQAWSDLQKAASELRSKIDDVVEEATAFMTFYEQLDDISGQATGLIDNLQNAISTYEDLSDELGLDTSASEVYTKSVRLIEDSVDNLNELDVLLVTFGDLYNTATDLSI